MGTTLNQPKLTPEGILFNVVVDSVGRDCLVTRDGLQALSQLKSIDESDKDVLALFHAYEAKIYGVARRLVGAQVPGDPLLLNSATFSPPHTS